MKAYLAIDSDIWPIFQVTVKVKKKTSKNGHSSTALIQ